MKKILFVVSILLSLAACKEDASREVVMAKTPDGRPFHFMPIQEKGITDITITIAWPMSWAYDSGVNPAVPYVASEAILSGGTDNLEPQDVLELFNDKNARGHLYVNSNHAVGELSFPKEHIEDVVSIASQMLASPQFKQPWITRVKQGMLVNQTKLKAQTATQMWDAARLTILGDGPLHNFLSLPDPTVIENVRIEDLRQWHRETIVQETAAIVVTGAISDEDAGKAIDTLLSALPKGQERAVASVQPDFTSKIILLHLPDAEKTTLGFIGQLPPTAEGDDTIDLLALHFFGQSGSGPLFDAIRTELRASYGFQTGYTNYDRARRIMYIGGEVETAKLAQAVDVIRGTYEIFRSKPDLTGLEDLRKGLAEGTTRNVSYVDIAARTILELALDDLDVTAAPRLGETIDSITAQDVRERLNSVFPSGSDLIVVAASSDATALPGACVITKIEQVQECQ